MKSEQETAILLGCMTILQIHVICNCITVCFNSFLMILIIMGGHGNAVADLGGLGGTVPHLTSQDMQKDGCVVIKTH